MSQVNRKTNRGRDRQRNISVRAVRRNPPDLRKLSRAVIQLAMEQAAAEAAAQAEANQRMVDRCPDGEQPDA